MMATDKYISFKNAAAQLGISRPALHKLVERIKVKKEKFELDNEVYILFTDFERIKTLREQAAARKGSN